MLYTKSHAYECDFSEVLLDKPESGYPVYYETELFDKGIHPKSYFRLTSIKEVNLNELGKYIVVSSRNRLPETLYKSMSSYFFAEYPDKSATTELTNSNNKRTHKNAKWELLPTNDCRYKKDGKCTLKSCINYKYDCDRPSMCIKQKR